MTIIERGGIAGLAAAMVLMAGAVHAAPNFSGEWKLNLSRSNYGSFPAPLGVTRKIVHADPKLSMTTTQKGPQSELTSQLNYTTDGKESVNKLQTGESKGSAQWIADKLMIESSREIQGATLKQKEIWTLSPDGKTLTIDSHVSLPNGEFDVKQVFEKQ
ncbi:MAG TPA: hypothetical protein VGR73_15470 [Bryobacteraceae bacterium]|nr:hypothetical protein [Bryobacteraceae bacterium]